MISFSRSSNSWNSGKASSLPGSSSIPSESGPESVILSFPSSFFRSSASRMCCSIGIGISAPSSITSWGEYLLYLAVSLEHLQIMEYRQLGYSGLKVPVLSFGTGTFGGGNEFFRAWGSSEVAEATRLVDICLEAGVNLFDTADVYSRGLAEEILGKAVEGRRDRVLISTKATFRMGDGPNDLGSSRLHLIRSCEASLRRLGTDYMDVYHLQGFDARHPLHG